MSLAPGVHITATEDGKGNVVGWIIGHEIEPGVWCDGYVPREPSATNHRGWNTSTGSVEGGDLSLHSSVHSESVKCHTHGDSFHGYVRNGTWVPA